MRTTALVVAGIVGSSALLVVLALAFGFGIDVSQATGQAFPIAAAAAILAGFMVELDRRVTW